MAGTSAMMTRKGAGIAAGASALPCVCRVLTLWRKNDEQSGSPLSLEELAELTGALTEKERARVDELSRLYKAPVSEPEEAIYPFDASEIAELEQIAAELEAGFTASAATSAPHVRVKRWGIGGMSVYNPTKKRPPPQKRQSEQSLRRQPLPRQPPPLRPPQRHHLRLTAGQEIRQAYWVRRYEEAADDSPEKFYLDLLRKGPGKDSWNYLVAPRESFPLNDTWVTRMNALKLESLPHEFSGKIEVASRDAAKAPGGQSGHRSTTR